MMSDLSTLLEELSSLGIRVSAEGGQLTLSAPKGALSDELRRRLMQHKPALVAALDSNRGAQAIAVTAQADIGNDSAPFALSDLQLGFYLADDPYMEYHVRPHAYMETNYQELDVVAYTGAWNRALRRHRRELCVVNSSIELQMLAEFEPVAFVEDDLTGQPAEHVQAHLARVRAQMARSELPLDRWPWFDLRISTWDQDGVRTSRVHYNHNSFFVDGFGTSKLLEEVEACYRGAPDRASLQLSYRDAVLALENLARSHEGEVARAYWFDRLAGLPAPPALSQVAATRRRRSHLERRSMLLPAAQWTAFKDAAATYGLTPSNAVIAAYAYVLAEWSNSDRFILSQMVTRRFPSVHADLLGMLGNFASLYPLEIALDPSLSFADNARRIQQQVLEDLKHLQIGGMQVLQELNRIRGSFGSAPSPFVVGSGLAMRAYRKPDFQVLETSQTVLDHQFFELEDGSLYAVWDLIEECFPPGFIDAMWAAFEGWIHELAAVAAAWDRRQVEFAHACVDAGATASSPSDWDPHARLHDGLARNARDGGAAAAVVDRHGTVDYAELDAWSAACAAQLRARGVGRGAIVAIMMDRGRELMACALAVARVGAAYVPIDPALPAERVGYMLQDCGCGVVLIQAEHDAAAAWPAGVTPLAIAEFAPTAQPVHDTADPAQVRGDDLAYVIYTSGTTGRPKGVMIEHAAAMNTIDEVNRRFGVTAHDRLFGVSSFGFDLSVYDLFGALAAGACVVYPNPDATLDPHHWLDLLQRERVTVWNSVPALMRLLVEAAQRRAVSLPDLRLVMLSGDKIPLELPDAVRAIAPNASVVSLGGATEASIWSIFYPIAAVDPTWPSIPYGYAMDGQSWRVLGRHGRPCPRWVRGELLIGGHGLARGYLNEPEKTARSFVIDAATGQRWYRTGDLGRYLDGDCIQWMGRIDSQIKLQGHRIEPAEIEAVLGEHPDIADAVVTVGTTANAHRILIGHVAGLDGLRAADCEAFLRSKLPAYMVPGVWRILPRLPVTANGKTDRDALARTALEVDPAAVTPRAHVPAADEIERQIRDIWQRVLALDSLGVTDDFFEVGGQSFDAIRIFAAIKQAFGQTYTLSDFWIARTVRALAARVKSGGAPSVQGQAAVRLNDERRGTGLFLVHPAGGSVMAYAALGRYLQRPLYGLQVGADPALASVRRSIPALAQRHVQAIRSAQPVGPYAIGGWSTGAVLAFEIAAQLQAAGEQLSSLVLLDGPAPWPRAEPDPQQLLAWFLQDLGLGLPVERLAPSSFAGLDADTQLRKASQVLELSYDTSLAAVYTVFRDQVAAAADYSPGAVQADVVVVRVEQDVVAEFAGHPAYDRADWGWSQHVSGKVVCLRVPGTHYSLFEDATIAQYLELMHG
ncbi:ATP-dependent serine activating enzyme [Xanthomonas arboricola pv. fragariae]|nr:ATP-dependent serine activating enzyme [Xanthomonas arboricola pv. fragariae]